MAVQKQRQSVRKFYFEEKRRFSVSRKILSTIIVLVLGFLWTLSVCADGPDPKGPSNLTPQEKYLMAIQAYEKCLDNWKEVSIIDCTTPECGPPEHYTADRQPRASMSLK